MMKKDEMIKTTKQGPVFEVATTVTVPAVTERMNPLEYLRHCPGLYLWSDFEKYVLPACQPIDSAPEASFTVNRFTRNLSGLEIHNGLQKGSFAKWHHLVAFIRRHANGEVESSLTNGYTKIFHMLGINGTAFLVYVRYRIGGPVQQVGAFDLSDSSNVLSRSAYVALSLDH